MRGLFQFFGPVFLLLAVSCKGSDSSDDAATDTGVTDTSTGEDSGNSDTSKDTGEEDPQDYAGWVSPDITCSTTSDCLSGEVCQDGVCQTDRCSGGEYESIAPLGNSHTLYANRELAVVDAELIDGSYWVDSFEPEGDTTQYTGSYKFGAAKLTDVAGGDPLGVGTEIFVVAQEESTEVWLLEEGGITGFDVGLVPEAIALGDVDGDGLDELFSVGGYSFTACDVDSGACSQWDFATTSSVMVDVSVGDVDGDAYSELVILLDWDGEPYFYVHNFDHAITGQPEYALTIPEVTPKRLDVGDLDGDRVAEIVVLVDRGWMGLKDDHINAYRLEWVGTDGETRRLWEKNAERNKLVDIAVGDRDADDQAEVAVLDSRESVDLYVMGEQELERAYESELGVTKDAAFLAFADQDNDSVRATLVSGPETIAGASVPTVVVLIPPYDAELAGWVASAGYGDGETFNENFSDTVSLGLSVDVGVGVEFLSIFKSKFSSKIGWRTSETPTRGTNFAVGERSSLRSDPEQFGEYYGAVSLAWGCFHGYTYELADPGDALPDSDGETIVWTVPVDGGTSLWSTPRYNALAKALGNLPIIEIPYAVGDLYSYPTSPQTLDGRAVSEDDLLFPELEYYEVSDVASVGWFMVRGENETNASNTGWDIGASANVTVSGVTVGTTGSAGWGQGYSLSVGETATFYGGIPPLYDDPSTPEDEFAENAYRLAPVIYTEHYTDATGSESTYYVYSYAVDR